MSAEFESFDLSKSYQGRQFDLQTTPKTIHKIQAHCSIFLPSVVDKFVLSMSIFLHIVIRFGLQTFGF
jgi:hypothetical protein